MASNSFVRRNRAPMSARDVEGRPRRWVPVHESHEALRPQGPTALCGRKTESDSNKQKTADTMVSAVCTIRQKLGPNQNVPKPFCPVPIGMA